MSDEIDAVMEELARAADDLPPLRISPKLPGPPSPAWLPAILARLREHFDEIEVRPPARDDAIARLLREVPDCPSDIVDFLRVCDGIDCGADVYGEIFGVERMLDYRDAILVNWGPRYLALRGDGCGDTDCLVFGPGPAAGAVVFCDRCKFGPDHLLASNFWFYLDMWSDHVVNMHGPDGESIERGDMLWESVISRFPGIDRLVLIARLFDAAQASGPAGVAESRTSHPWPFVDAWMDRRDPGLAALRASQEVTRWLAAHGHDGDGSRG